MKELLVLAPADQTVAAVESALKPAGPAVRRVNSSTEVIKYLDDRTVDAVLLPVGIEAVDIVRIVRLVREVDPEVPIVLVGPVDDRTSVQRALDAGADSHVETIEAELREELTGIGLRSQIRTELRRHRRLGRLVRDIGRSLFTAETVDEIEGLVYDRLAEADLYQFIWLGTPADGDQFEIHVPVEGTVSLSELPAVDDSTGLAAFERALETGSVEVVGDEGEFTRGVRSGNASNSTTDTKSNRLTGLKLAIVPFVGQETVVGMAVLANDRTVGIDSAERSVLESLGSLVGTAIWLVEVREELTRAKRRVEEFAGLVAHEIRNPLAIAMTQLELLREGEDGRAVERVESSLQRIDRHISNLVSLATGLDPETVEDRPLAETASAAWEDLEAPGAELIIESSTTVSADHELLTQLFTNLFRNALEQEDESRTVVRLGRLDDGFFVADNGAGIPAEQRDDVFEWGYSETEGLGIGLTVVREICRAHGWSIQATEAENGGARFEISFDGTVANRASGDRLAQLFDKDATGENYSSSI